MRRDPRNRRGESGQALIYVTLALVLALLIIPPLLGFVFTGGRSAQIREDRMLQVHAADAGIEDGYCFVVANATDLPQSPEDPPTEIDMGSINGYDVDVQIFKDDITEGVYKILSTAASDSGGDVRIESYTSQWDYYALMDNALTSKDTIDLHPNSVIYGNVTVNNPIDEKKLDLRDGILKYGETVGWPGPDELADFYYDDVDGEEPLLSDEIVFWTDEIWEDPIYSVADPQLDIYSNGTDFVTVTLGGTVYVTGDLWIGKTGQDFRLELGNQTIFCEQSISVGGKCDLVGPGCIIAIDNIDFAPKLLAEEFIFVMAVGREGVEGSGTVTVQPQGVFHGSIAGREVISLQPNVQIVWEEYDPASLNFPPGSKLPRVISYVILD